MPRTNKVVFNKISKDFKDLQMAYNHAINQYFGSGDWNCNYDFFSDFACTADLIYGQANRLSSEIGGMLNATKFESAEKNKYQNILLFKFHFTNNTSNLYTIIFYILTRKYVLMIRNIYILSSVMKKQLLKT